MIKSLISNQALALIKAQDHESFQEAFGVITSVCDFVNSLKVKPTDNYVCRDDDGDILRVTDIESLEIPSFAEWLIQPRAVRVNTADDMQPNLRTINDGELVVSRNELNLAVRRLIAICGRNKLKLSLRTVGDWWVDCNLSTIENRIAHVDNDGNFVKFHEGFDFSCAPVVMASEFYALFDNDKWCISGDSARIKFSRIIAKSLFTPDSDIKKERPKTASREVEAKAESLK